MMRRTFVSFALLAVLVAGLVTSGCGSGMKCPNVGQSEKDLAAQEYENRCPTKEDVEQGKQKEEVESEAHEAESVIKQRKAEETANAVEQAAK
jgi:hypothetical protein